MVAFRFWNDNCTLKLFYTHKCPRFNSSSLNVCSHWASFILTRSSVSAAFTGSGLDMLECSRISTETIWSVWLIKVKVPLYPTKLAPIRIWPKPISQFLGSLNTGWHLSWMTNVKIVLTVCWTGITKLILYCRTLAYDVALWNERKIEDNLLCFYSLLHGFYNWTDGLCSKQASTSSEWNHALLAWF